MTILDLDQLAAVSGGAAPDKSQAELRALAQEHCPQTYARYRNRATITRPIAERCLDEAGYGGFKGYLDRYFPRR